LFLQYRVETGTGAKAAPYAMKPESLFLWGKAEGAFSFHLASKVELHPHKKARSQELALVPIF
jgi:hypothetical protein